MTAPEPVDPPLDGDQCAAWAQVDELPDDVQALLTEDLWCIVLARASDVLWGATGRRWRNRQVVETAVIDLDGRCVPLPRPDRSVVLPPSAVRLPRPDVTEVLAVQVGGAPFAAWALRGNWVDRTDGHGWSAGAEFTYRYGRLAPAAGRLAVLELATEIGRWLAGKPCQLPARVSNVQRQGVSYAVLDDLQFLQDGLTGLYSVDLWIKAVNPHRTTQEARAWSPDVAVARRIP